MNVITNAAPGVDFARIPQEKVKKLVRMHGITCVPDFGKLKSLCFDPEDGAYHAHHKSFSVAAPVEKVWHFYKTVKPEEAWNGKMVSFGLQYSRKENKISYAGDPFQCIEDGLIIILNLKLLFGLLHMAVAHEITGVDEAKKEIKICYVEKGASTGSQWISFSADGEAKTIVHHRTKYRSNSHFRDTRLYPFFHEKAMTEFHQNIIRKILSTP